MTWREDLRRVTITVSGKQRNLVGASFRGVAFFVENSERGGGRRTVTHEFPFRDDPFVEDLGRKARTFHVDGYLLGDGYLAERDVLLSALEDVSGPGELVHPYYGVKKAICTQLSTHETRADGGYVSFALEFQETPTQAPVPIAVGDDAALVSTSADAANAATDAEFAQRYDASGLPGHALASAETAVANATAALKSKLAPIVGATQEAAQLAGQLALLTAETSSLVRTPALILGKFHDAIGGLVQTSLSAPGAVMNALISAYSVDLGAPVAPTTSTRVRELANQTALIGALRSIFAIEAARLAPVVPYVSIDDAIAARDQITALLDEQADAAGDTAYPALVDLRSQVLSAVPGSSAFASIVTITQRVAIPSLLLAYQRYGAVDLEADILARNDVRNPAFVVGELKVLTDGG